MDEDDDFFVPEELGAVATAKIVDSWTSVWASALPMLENLLVEYQQQTTVAQLLAIPENTLNVMILLPEDEDEDVEFRFDLNIDKKTEYGSYVFGVIFADLTAEQAEATF